MDEQQELAEDLEDLQELARLRAGDQDFQSLEEVLVELELDD